MPESSTSRLPCLTLTNAMLSAAVAFEGDGAQTKSKTCPIMSWTAERQYWCQDLLFIRWWRMWQFEVIRRGFGPSVHCTVSLWCQPPTHWAQGLAVATSYQPAQRRQSHTTAARAAKYSALLLNSVTAHRVIMLMYYSLGFKATKQRRLSAVITAAAAANSCCVFYGIKHNCK